MKGRKIEMKTINKQKTEGKKRNLIEFAVNNRSKTHTYYIIYAVYE
jgi:hypothetical protein